MGSDAKREYVRAIRWRYRESGRRRKTLILDEFCAVCGYQRKYAIRLLNRLSGKPKRRPGPDPVHGPEVLQVVKAI